MRARPEKLIAATLALATFVVVSSAVAAIVPQKAPVSAELSCRP
jgi:hypothetical protein